MHFKSLREPNFRCAQAVKVSVSLTSSFVLQHILIESVPRAGVFARNLHSPDLRFLRRSWLV